MTDPVLELRSLHKSFGALKATDDVSLTLVPGEVHALIGPNGAGKSTLMGQISGKITPNSGEVCLDGRDITALSVAQRARAGLGRSFQISSLIPEYSAQRNVMLALQARAGHSYRFLRPVMYDKALRDGAQAMLERVGLGARASVEAAVLSHGERRLLEIAVALALKPKCFLLDEPMAGLGSEGTARLVEFLETLKHEAPILLIEHDMDAVFRLADRISVLVYGRIIATGSAQDIRTNPQVRAVYLGQETSE